MSPWLEAMSPATFEGRPPMFLSQGRCRRRHLKALWRCTSARGDVAGDICKISGKAHQPEAMSPATFLNIARDVVYDLSDVADDSHSMRFISPATSPGGRPTSPATSPGGPLTSPATSPGHLLTSPAMSSNILAMSLTIFFRIPSCRQRHRQAVTRHRLRHRQVISTSPATSPSISAMSLTTFSCSP